MRLLLTLTLLVLLVGLALLGQSRGRGEPALATDNPAVSTSAVSAADTPARAPTPDHAANITPLHERLDPAVVREVNERLAPPDQQYPEIIDGDDVQIDLGARSTSVTVAVIDEDGELIVTDLTQPIPEQ